LQLDPIVTRTTTKLQLCHFDDTKMHLGAFDASDAQTLSQGPVHLLCHTARSDPLRPPDVISVRLGPRTPPHASFPTGPRAIQRPPPQAAGGPPRPQQAADAPHPRQSYNTEVVHFFMRDIDNNIA
jgi:hypothetical protein